MKTETLAALKASIRHWSENACAMDPGAIDLSVGACALCCTYNKGDGPTACGGCPVFDRTLRSYCGGTPYDAAYRAYTRWETAVLNGDANQGILREDYHREALRELAFLRSLLPEGETA